MGGVLDLAQAVADRLTRHAAWQVSADLQRLKFSDDGEVRCDGYGAAGGMNPIHLLLLVLEGGGASGWLIRATTYCSLR